MNDRSTFNAFRNHLNCTRAAIARHDLSRRSASTNRAERLWTGFSSPVGIAFDKSGNLFVAEWSAGRVSRIAPDGKRSAFAGHLSGPWGLAIDTEGC